MQTEQRKFSRIRFQSGAHLLVDDTETACEICDLSLKGALLVLQEESTPASLEVGGRCMLELRLDDAGTAVRMEGDVAHREGRRLGLVCREIDLDSITHLRRLLELNLGDAALLNREFSALIAD
ncbi:PilZ domain-containing protein [Azoarcus indigens]|uniref:Cyclic diguanosine monophosphate-binding protein n=1 Tax=Azoarcus indigens TaxID=29545 RepID=A0A4R6E873_9RHOO|nr:PilZ domain-containing protein [Azoarcus indigens]NMG67747.1 PilZ domain-containing protein [Azoarcus indigens]TDN53469.1 PilZ domain-containing protein [Azoarcus indigens]